jgi:hypothetical protein
MHRPRKLRSRFQLRSPEPGAPGVESRAVEDLRFIRQTMERSAAFTAVPGWGMVAVGVSALVAAAAAWNHAFDTRWIGIWVIDALLAVLLAVTAIQRKAAQGGLPWISGPGKKVAMSFLPAVVAAALLTIPLTRAHLGWVLPGLWMLLYGAGVIAGGAFSVAAVPAMGVSFVAVGATAVLVSCFFPTLAPALGNGAMAAGFGGLHIGFGVWIARRHGG